MRRNDAHVLAQAKIDDAILLLSSGRSSNAYYLAGYAIEIALKACISKQISNDTIPDLEFVKSIYAHNLRSLIKVAGLSADLANELNSNEQFAANWAIVCEWGPESRYTPNDTGTAQIMVEAVNSPDNGVLRWIKAHW